MQQGKTRGLGVRAGSRASHGTGDAVSAVPASIPDAAGLWPLCGYAPGGYMGRCHDCGLEWYEGDKRASQCLACAIKTAKRMIAEGQRLKQATHLFREFVIRNASQWEAGANHHHPIWAMLADLLPGDDIRNGPDWRFILPDNRLTWEECHAQGMAAPLGGETGTGSTVGNSPVPEGDAPDPPSTSSENPHHD